jgi:hypothetical protein
MDLIGWFLEKASRDLDKISKYFAIAKYKSKRERLKDLRGYYYCLLLLYYAIIFIPLYIFIFLAEVVVNLAKKILS